MQLNDKISKETKIVLCSADTSFMLPKVDFISSSSIDLFDFIISKPVDKTKL
jgi:hypothetical protein